MRFAYVVVRVVALGTLEMVLSALGVGLIFWLLYLAANWGLLTNQYPIC